MSGTPFVCGTGSASERAVNAAKRQQPVTRSSPLMSGMRNQVSQSPTVFFFYFPAKLMPPKQYSLSLSLRFPYYKLN